MPKTLLPSIILSALIATTAQAKVYKWVTKDGTVVYSDQPHPEAEVLDIKPLHPYKAPSYQPIETQPTTTTTPEVESSGRYSSVTIDSPEHDSNIHGNGNFSVSVSSNPALKSGDKYQLLINGKPTGAASTMSQFNIQHLNRGQHSLSVSILNKQSKVVITSPAISVFVHRPSVKR